MRIEAIDRIGRRSRISTAADTALLACLYIVSLGPSLGQAVDDFPIGMVFTLSIKVILIVPLVMAVAAILRVAKRVRRRARRVQSFSDSVIGKLLEDAGLPKRRLTRLKAYRTPNPRQCAVQITGLFRSQLIYTSGFELLCKYNRSVASNILFHEAAHIRMHDTSLLGMLIVASCAAVSNQLFFGYYSNPTQFFGLLLIIIFFTYSFRRREYTADAIAINGLENKANYIVGLFKGSRHQSSFGHPSTQARIASLYTQSPVLSTQWQVVGLGFLLLFFYWRQPSSANNELLFVIELLARLAFSIVPVYFIISELLKGPRRKVPSSKPECFDNEGPTFKGQRGHVQARDVRWHEAFAADCAIWARRLTEEDSEDKAVAFVSEANRLLNQLGCSNNITDPREPLSPALDVESSRSDDRPSRLRQNVLMPISRALAQTSRNQWLIVSLASFLLIACFYIALLFGGGPRPVKTWPNVFGGFGSAADLRITGFRNEDAILDVGLWPSEGRSLYSRTRPVLPFRLKDRTELIATSGSGKYSAFVRTGIPLKFGSRGERLDLTEAEAPEIIIIRANDSDRIVHRSTVTAPIITVGFSSDDKYAALSLWRNSNYASDIQIVSLANPSERSAPCSVDGQVVEAVRVQPGGRSFTAVGYSAKHELSLDYSGFVPTRAQLISTGGCKAIGHADFLSIYRAFDWTSSGKTIAFYSRETDGLLRVHDLETGITKTIDAGSVKTVSLSPDGTYVFTGIMDRPESAFHPATAEAQRYFVKMWSIETGALKATVRVTHQPHSMAISPTGQYLWLTSCFDRGDNQVSCDVNVWTSSVWRMSWQPWNNGADSDFGRFFARQTGLEKFLR